MRTTWLTVLLSFAGAALAAAQGTRRATFTLHWEETRELNSSDPQASFGEPLKETRTERLAADATLVFVIPDIDYRSQGSVTVALTGGDVGGPEYEELPGRPRRKLPPTKLVSFTGQASKSYDEYRQTGPAAEACESRSTARGDLTLSAQTQSVSFLSTVTGRGADVQLSVPGHAVVSGRTTSTCRNRPSEEPLTVGEVGFTARFPTSAWNPGFEAGWTGELKPTATGYTGSAHYESRKPVERMRGGTIGAEVEARTISFTIDLGGPPPAPSGGAPVAASGPPPPLSPQPPSPAMGPGGMSPVSKGEAAFTQGGKDARWQLASGRLMAPGGVLMAAVLTYAPGGGGGGQNILSLVVGSRGGPPAVTALSVRGGPAGDGMYQANSGGCALQLDRSVPAGIAGTVTCMSGFQGVPITKLTFAAVP